MVSRGVADDRCHMLDRPRTSAWTLYLLTLVSAIPLAAIVAASNPMPEGGCSGIGFGCSLYGWDAAGFVLLIVGVPYALGLALVLGVLSLVTDRRSTVTTIVATVGLAVPWLLVPFVRQ
jgi:hypothetical protein